MMMFLLHTLNENGDNFYYFILSEDKPTNEEIICFLIENGNDVEDGYCYESIIDLIEITEEKFKEIKHG